MKINRQTPVGFTEVATSELPAPSIPAPQKSPYIIFKIPLTVANYNYMKEKGYLKLGTLYREGVQGTGTYTLTITGHRKVQQACTLFNKDHALYLESKNQFLYPHLRELGQKCAARQQVKAPTKPPTKSKLLSDYEEDPNQENLAPSLNATKIYRKKKNHAKRYVFKTNPTGRSISDIEAFNGFCSRLLLGRPCHPKTNPVHHAGGGRAGVLSEFVPGFTPLFDAVKRKDASGKPIPPKNPDFSYKVLNADLLVGDNIARHWVAAYVEDDDDLHLRNYGFALRKKDPHKKAERTILKIDPDRASWSKTAKFHETDPTRGMAENDIPPVLAFPVTQSDIRTLPLLKDAKPTKRLADWNFFDKDQIKALIQDDLYQEQKYYAFLKRILIPDSVYAAIGEATIGSLAKRQQLVQLKQEKTRELRQALLAMPEFRKYVQEHPEAIEEIKQEFADSNEEFKKENKESNAALRVDLNQVDQDFREIQKQVCSEVARQKTPAISFPISESVATQVTQSALNNPSNNSFVDRHGKTLASVMLTWGIAGAICGGVFGLAGGPLAIVTAIAGFAAGVLVGGVIGITGCFIKDQIEHCMAEEPKVIPQTVPPVPKKSSSALVLSQDSIASFSSRVYPQPAARVFSPSLHRSEPGYLVSRTLLGSSREQPVLNATSEPQAISRLSKPSS